MQPTVIGTSVSRIEGPEKVAGETRYSADLWLPGMLWGKLLRSPLPYALIRKIDTSAAWRVTQDLNTTEDAVFQAPWTSSGLPTITFPSGLASSGMPLGVQLAAPPFAEGRLLGAARWCEEALAVNLWPAEYP